MIDVDVPKVGLYSHACEVLPGSRLLFMGGRSGIGSDGHAAGLDVGTQYLQAMENMGKVLAGAGMTYQNLVQLTTYLVDPDDVPLFYQARAPFYERTFPDGVYPPNTLLIIDRLVHAELKIEIIGIAAA
jgi:enamine deaminase RidA (YjgF/YER057c/UK114 family)